MTSKSETIEAILHLNPNANPMFLSEFSNDDLDRYLHRLRGTSELRSVCCAAEEDRFPDRVPRLADPSIRGRMEGVGTISGSW